MRNFERFGLSADALRWLQSILMPAKAECSAEKTSIYWNLLLTQCAAEGITVSGPHSADSLYYRAHTGEFDVVIAPYHDQGLIPVKLIAHGESTNVTLGTSLRRTSPDHGTAFSIAGKGEADPAGMASAMRCARGSA